MSLRVWKGCHRGEDLAIGIACDRPTPWNRRPENTHTLRNFVPDHIASLSLLPRPPFSYITVIVFRPLPPLISSVRRFPLLVGNRRSNLIVVCSSRGSPITPLAPPPLLLPRTLRRIARSSADATTTRAPPPPSSGGSTLRTEGGGRRGGARTMMRMTMPMRGDVVVDDRRARRRRSTAAPVVPFVVLRGP